MKEIIKNLKTLMGVKDSSDIIQLNDIKYKLNIKESEREFNVSSIG